jgi:hypothetical protein
MSVPIAGNAGVIAEVDEARNLQVFQTIPGYPTAGGFYTVTGFTTAVVAAALAANTTLMAARFSTGSTRKLYLARSRVFMSIATPGAAGGIPSVLGLQRFTTATPTGGTARTVDRSGPTKGSATDLTDVRDSNAALVVTSVVFGNLIASSQTPTHGVNVGAIEWIFDPEHPIEFSAGDGFCLRTQNAGPATATWNYSYNFHFFERT